MKLTVSMITLNEERAVAKVVEDIRRVAPEAEIFLVDSSKDRTAEIAESLGCRVLKQFPPQGYGPAMDKAVADSRGIRRSALTHAVPHYTTMAGARAAVHAIVALKSGALEVAPLQAYFRASF